jgi:hypothetical protein
MSDAPRPDMAFAEEPEADYRVPGWVVVLGSFGFAGSVWALIWIVAILGWVGQP